MAEYFVTILIIIISAVFFAAGFFIKHIIDKNSIDSASSKIDSIKKESEKKAEEIKKESVLAARAEVIRHKETADEEIRIQKQELGQLEKRLSIKEDNLEKRISLIEKKETDFMRRERTLAQSEKTAVEKEKLAEEKLKEKIIELEKVSGMTSAEAKSTLINSITEEAKHESAKAIKRIEDETREIADKKAKEIIATAIQRYAGDYVAEKSISSVQLPSDEMKGRIIGREGRNIRALEAATGVDLIIDETPEAVILSSFNPVKREIARLSLERLIADGRIHPARIEEIVAKVEEELNQAMKEAGEQATFDVGIHGVHPELLKLLGRLKYRTSYSQNVYNHSIEVAFLCGIMAAELNINVKQAKRAGLLHDIGKAVDHEVEGSHAVIGADLAKKFGESPKVIHAIAAHHFDEEPNSILAVLVSAADALSAARPGARKEMFETYVKRLEDLESIANSFSGVAKSYVIQAGREIRAIVQSQKITDEDSVMLSKDIAKKIETTMQYPGQIKVTVIRETRATEFAR
ncbi:MAG: ribonuclease Y [Deltaproteobacteria bacterium]|nr:ribonuclease Y [Deltaproteobacteria bacterium]